MLVSLLMYSLGATLICTLTHASLVAFPSTVTRMENCLLANWSKVTFSIRPEGSLVPTRTLTEELSLLHR